MAIAPAGKVIMLKEVGEATPFGDVNIPAILATIRNTYGTSTKPLNTIEGGQEAFDLLDQQLQELGV